MQYRPTKPWRVLPSTGPLRIYCYGEFLRGLSAQINFNGSLQFIKFPETERYTFEAIILLSVLANYHKSEAAKLNPYLLRMKETDDEDFMRKICWASNFAAETAIKSVLVPDKLQRVSNILMLQS